MPMLTKGQERSLKRWTNWLKLMKVRYIVVEQMRRGKHKGKWRLRGYGPNIFTREPMPTRYGRTYYGSFGNARDELHAINCAADRVCMTCGFSSRHRVQRNELKCSNAAANMVCRRARPLAAQYSDDPMEVIMAKRGTCPIPNGWKTATPWK